MRFPQATISGVWTIDPDFHEDERGRALFELWCSKEFAERGIAFAPVQPIWDLARKKVVCVVYFRARGSISFAKAWI